MLHFPDWLDEPIARWFAAVWHKSASLDAAMMIAGQWTPVVMMGVIFVASTGYGLANPGLAERAPIVTVIAAFLARLINEPINRWAGRPRPFESVSPYALLDHESGDSFPSNHATGAFALAIGMHAIPAYNAVLLVLAFWLAFARLYNGLHYLTDVIVGALHGATIALVVQAIAAVWWATTY